MEKVWKEVKAYIVVSDNFEGWTVFNSEADRLFKDQQTNSENAEKHLGRVRYNINNKDEFRVLST